MEIEPFPTELLRRCQETVGGLQRDFAKLLGISDRTMSRWLGDGIAVLRPEQYHALARAVFPADPALAAEIAARCGTTLQALGLGVPSPPVTPPPSQPAVEVRPPPAAPVLPSAALLDSIVCAGADLHGYPNGHIRAIVAATFARAQELGLTTEAVARAFASLGEAAKRP